MKRLPILSNRGATQRLTEIGGKAVEGVTFPIAFDWDSPNPPYQEFREIYRNRYQREPGFAAFYAYNAARVILAVLKTRTEIRHPAMVRTIAGQIVDPFGDIFAYPIVGAFPV